MTFPLTCIVMLRGPAFDSVHNILDNLICIKKDMLFFKALAHVRRLH